MDTIERDIRDFITGTLGRDLDGIGRDESLLEAGLIDSLGVVQLVTFIGERYAIEVTEDDMMPENFDSLAAIVGFVERRQGGPGR